MHRAVKRGEDGQYAGGLTYGPDHLVRWVGLFVVIVPAVAFHRMALPQKDRASPAVLSQHSALLKGSLKIYMRSYYTPS